MLVVRVKRSRNDDPAEELCIYEDDNYQPHNKRKRNIASALTEKLAVSDDKVTSPAGNGIAAETLRSKNRVILQRISTIDTFSKSTLDNDTVKVLHHRKHEAEEALPQPPTKRTKLILTQGKKSLPVVGQESCIVLDMMQIHQQQPSSSSSAAQQPTPTKSKILDPATRSLAQGILTAIQKNNFDDLSTALIQGADAKYQLDMEKGGYTALMAACMKGNLRMVKRILGCDVSVLAKNKDGLMAIELIKETPRNQQDVREMRELLQKAMIREHQANVRKEKMVEDNTATTTDDFVVDIYCIKTTMMADDEEPAASSTTAEESQPSEQEMNDIPASIVCVEGLKIMEDGNVEILSYDSDWSDLADDEDPDSNDERFAGNDYPDESDEDNGGTLFEEDYDHVENSDDEGGYGRNHYRNKKVNFRKQANADIDDELNAALDDGQKGVPIFDRNQSIGRVLRSRPMYGADPVTHGYDAEGLRELWEQDQEVDFDDEEGDIPMKERLHMMRMRTGMAFASNPREFNHQGLPKYGVDLSDDEMDHRMMVDDYATSRPGKQTYAYDPDLDGSEEDN